MSDTDKIIKLKGLILGTELDSAESEFITDGPPEDRTVLMTDERIINKALNALNTSDKQTQLNQEGFAIRLNRVIGDDSYIDKDAFDYIGENLIQAVAKLKAGGGGGGSGPKGDPGAVFKNGYDTESDLRADLPTGPPGGDENSAYLVGGHVFVWADPLDDGNWDWLDCGSIAGPVGPAGPAGPAGPQGPAGKSAYALATEAPIPYEGTETEFAQLLAMLEEKIQDLQDQIDALQDCCSGGGPTGPTNPVVVPGTVLWEMTYVVNEALSNLAVPLSAFAESDGSQSLTEDEVYPMGAPDVIIEVWANNPLDGFGPYASTIDPYTFDESTAISIPLAGEGLPDAPDGVSNWYPLDAGAQGSIVLNGVFGGVPIPIKLVKIKA